MRSGDCQTANHAARCYHAGRSPCVSAGCCWRSVCCFCCCWVALTARGFLVVPLLVVIMGHQEVTKVYVLVHDESEASSLHNAADLLRQMKASSRLPPHAASHR